ncbi:MAG: VWA domain-containing protein [Phaeodactylibacter sp.]|nr:VWA domain-containing protein [Phaeodactylibacter sp.]
MNRFAIFILLLLLCFSTLFAQEKTATPDILLILDGSGSMWAKAGSEYKIEVARQSISRLMDKLPAGTRLGLMVYGHRHKDDCEDIELLMPIAPLDKAAAVEKMKALNPTGKTPITASLKQAFALLSDARQATTAILVSDGLETCGADPCEAARLAREQGLPLVLHVVGFGLEEESVAQLECIAQAGGGLYFDAKDSESLNGALEQAVETPLDTTGGFLWVKGVENGELTDLSVNVRDEKGGWVAGGRTYQSPETNPRLIRLPKGTYKVDIDAVKMKGAARQSFEAKIAEGDTVRYTADFSTGELAIGVTRNGELSDATINVFSTAGGPAVASGRSYRSAANNPKVFTLTAGAYFVEIGSAEVKGVDKVVIRDIQVKGNERASFSHEFESGTLKVGVRNASGLVDAIVRIIRPDDRAPVAQGRTYTHAGNNPKAFELATGKYKVEIEQIKGAGKASFEIEIKKGETAEKILEW